MQKEDDRTGTPCPAPNREERQEAVAVIERETQQRLNCLISPARRQLNVRSSSSSLFHRPATPTQHNHHHGTPLSCSQGRYTAKRCTHSHTYTHTYTIKAHNWSLHRNWYCGEEKKINFSLEVERHSAQKELWEWKRSSKGNRLLIYKFCCF